MENKKISRRDALKKLGQAGVVVAGAYMLPSLLAACAKGTSDSSGSIKIGCVASLTGGFAIYGQNVANHVQMAIEEINESGGILGREVEFILEDGASDPSVHVQKSTRLVEDHQVHFVIGAITSPERDAMAGPVADRGGILFNYPELYEGGETNPNIICTGPVPQQQVIPFIPWLIENYGKKFYLVGADYEWPHETFKVVKKIVEEHGGEILGEEYMPFTATDFSAIAQRIRASDVDVIYNNYNGPNYVTFLNQLENAGITAQNKGIATSFLGDVELPGLAPNISEGIVVCKEYFYSLDTPENKAHVQKFQEKFGQDTIPAGPGIGAFNGVNFYKAAVEKAQSTDTEAVKKALLEVKIKSPTGELEFAANENHVNLNMYIAKCVNGKYELVKELGKIAPQQEKIWS